jgi:hypothetical protein
MTTVGDMTLDELKQLIVKLLDEHRIQQIASDLDLTEGNLGIEDELDQRTLEEVFASIERNRWNPPTDSPTPSEMIRTDRDEHA